MPWTKKICKQSESLTQELPPCQMEPKNLPAIRRLAQNCRKKKSLDGLGSCQNCANMRHRSYREFDAFGLCSSEPALELLDGDSECKMSLTLLLQPILHREANKTMNLQHVRVIMSCYECVPQQRANS